MLHCVLCGEDLGGTACKCRGDRHELCCEADSPPTGTADHSKTLRSASQAGGTLCDRVSCETQRGGHCHRGVSELVRQDGGGDGLSIKCNDANNSRNSETPTRRGREMIEVGQ